MKPESDKYYRLLENLPDAFAYHQVVTDNEGIPVDYIFLEINEAFEKMTGLKRGEVIGKKVTEVLPGIDKSEFDWIGVYGKVALSGEPARFENFSEPLGRWYDVSVYSDEPGYFAVTFRDITEQKRVEQTLKESETKFRSYIDNAPYGVFVHNEKGEILEANKTSCLMSGYSEEEMLGMNFSQLIPQSDRQQSRDRFHVITEQGNVFFELPHIRKDGTLREWSVNAVKLSDTHFLGFTQDITEKRRAEEALRESEMRSQALVKAIPDLLFRFNREGVYLEAVVKDETMLHAKSYSLYRQNRLIGKTMAEVLPAPIAEKLMTGIEKTLASGEIQIFEYSYKVKDSEHYFEARLAPIGTTEVVSIVRDITERKSHEAKLQYISFHDQLTGLYNRRYYENELKRLNNSREHPIAVISADLDGLKLINDTLGHSEGDNYLKAGAELLKSILRASDILARVGGDEFAAILPRTTLKVGRQLVERIRRQVEEYNRQKTTGPPLSMSIGVAVSESGEHLLEETCKKADAAMYEDKKQRRDNRR